jgi:glycine/D-amino acid oxidase-like deaminating enzyme
MICDTSVLKSETNYDVIVIGAGPAGLAIAHAAVGSRMRVLVLEAGGAGESRAARSVYEGEALGGHPPLDMYRVPALGGTSRIWGGRCIPFDRIDFAARDWIPLSGWPISYDDVARYYPAALDLAEAGTSDREPADFSAAHEAELVPGLDGSGICTTLERFSRPTDFWKRCRQALKSASGVDVLPHTRLVGLTLNQSRSRVVRATVMTRDGAKAELRAPAFVLALGGLETTRMLLAAGEGSSLGNAGGHLGRYYMSHLCTTAATVTFAGDPAGINHLYGRDPDGIYVRRRLWVTEAAQRERRLPNVTFRTHLPDPGDPTHRNGVLSAMFLSKLLVQREYAAKFSECPVPARAYRAHAVNVLRDWQTVASFGRMWTRERVLAKRKLPSVVLASAANIYPLEFHAEQAPNPDSRVRLATARDRDGIPRLTVDWRLLDSDVERLQRAHELLDERLTATGTGRLAYDPGMLALRCRRFGIVGGHHLGTTRMSRDPRDGVVDTDCRVHGVSNLFVASGSVFPTSGQANPTLTIVALALRLGDHLHAQVCNAPSGVRSGLS